MSDNVDSGPGGNPYAAPLSPGDAATPDDERKSGDADLRACVGPNADYYLRQWHEVLRGRGQGTGFNWAACLLSGLWLPYRKMYLATLIFYTVIIAELILEVVLEVVIESPPPAWLDRVVGLAFAIVCGAFANRWYLSHVTKVIARSHSEGLTGRDRRLRIASRGGTSLVAPWRRLHCSWQPFLAPPSLWPCCFRTTKKSKNSCCQRMRYDLSSRRRILLRSGARFDILKATRRRAVKARPQDDHTH